MTKTRLYPDEKTSLFGNDLFTALKFDQTPNPNLFHPYYTTKQLREIADTENWLQ